MRHYSQGGGVYIIYNYMEENIPTYWSIIPAEIKYSRDLTDFSKLLYGEIMSLSNKDGYCYATNKYFAELFGKEPDTVSGTVSLLKKYEFIIVEIVDQFQRKIYPQVGIGVRGKILGGTDSNPKGVGLESYNNNKYNNKENNIYTNTSKKVLDRVKKVKRKTYIESVTPQEYIDNFNLDSLVKFYGNHSDFRLNILAYYVYVKNLKPDNWKEAKIIFGRHIKAATILKDFSVPKIKKEIDRLNRDMPREFTLETVYKYLTK